MGMKRIDPASNPAPGPALRSNMLKRTASPSHLSTPGSDLHTTQRAALITEHEYVSLAEDFGDDNPQFVADYFYSEGRDPLMQDTSSTPTRLHIPLASAGRLDKVKLPVKAGYAPLVDLTLTEVVEHRSAELLTTTTGSCNYDVDCNHTGCELTRCKYFSLKAE